MTANFVLLEKVTVGASGASSVTFNNIPQTGYTDLMLKGSARVDSSTNAFGYVQFNGSSSNFQRIHLDNNGGTPASYSASDNLSFSTTLSTNTANTFNSFDVYIPNYTSSNYKSFSVDCVVENNASTTNILDILGANLWSNTSAITSVAFYPGSGNFVQYSTFSLYGIAAVGTTPTKAPFAAGGDIIQTDGTYWYHAFLSSGTFTPAKALSCDYLVVAGGGGGGSSNNAGGGGAGGLRSTVTATGGGGSVESVLALAANSTQTVTIGGGGSLDTNGTNSVFSTITSTGGGKGGYDTTFAAGNGGSGGGAGNNNVTAGTPTSGQGYAGGVGDAGGTGPVYGGAGGGGAGAAGTNGTPTVVGVGGNGVYTAISDAFGALSGFGQLSSSHYYFAGGGGGGGNTSTSTGTGGLGGGARGAYTSNPAPAATPNTGGGGGGYGGAPGQAGSAGGSGIVIVRYLA
jgi:hypothetical protein